MTHGVRRRVLLVLGWYDHRLHGGIEKYAQEHHWDLSEDLAREKMIPWGWNGDGILAWLGRGEDLAQFVVETKKPTVDFSFRRPLLNFAHVLENTAETAALVADHFISKSFRNFLFYSDVQNWIYDERGTAFVEHLAAQNLSARWLKWQECSRFETGRTAWKRKRQWLANQLKEMPKPIAAFAASDGLALEMLEVCEEMGLAVPEEVAIVGAGNSLLAVDAMRTPISSVDVNMAMIGYEGARLLDHLMARQARPQKIVRISPSRLIVRKSSDAVAVKHEGIARTLRFMWAHCHEPITVNDLARVAAMSIRNFHQIFLATLGRSPGSELNRLRIERAKQLLSDSTDKIDIIAEKCGYEIDNSFRVAFKRVTGVSPQQYRKQNNEAYLGRN